MSAVDLDVETGGFYYSQDDLSRGDDGREESENRSGSSEDVEHRPSQQLDYGELELAQRLRRRQALAAQRSSCTVNKHLPRNAAPTRATQLSSAQHISRRVQVMPTERTVWSQGGRPRTGGHVHMLQIRRYRAMEVHL